MPERTPSQIGQRIALATKNGSFNEYLRRRQAELNNLFDQALNDKSSTEAQVSPSMLPTSINDTKTPFDIDHLFCGYNNCHEGSNAISYDLP